MGQAFAGDGPGDREGEALSREQGFGVVLCSFEKVGFAREEEALSDVGG